MHILEMDAVQKLTEHPICRPVSNPVFFGICMGVDRPQIEVPRYRTSQIAKNRGFAYPILYPLNNLPSNSSSCQFWWTVQVTTCLRLMKPWQEPRPSPFSSYWFEDLVDNSSFCHQLSPVESNRFWKNDKVLSQWTAYWYIQSQTNLFLLFLLYRFVWIGIWELKITQ